MRVSLDGREFAAPKSDHQTLQELLNEVSSGRLGRRLVVNVNYNGTSLAGAALNERLACPMNPDDEIELQTEDRFELAEAALNEAADQLDELSAELPQVVSNTGPHGGKGGGDSLSDALRKWQVVPQTIHGAASLAGFDPDTFASDGQTVAAHLGNLVEKLGSVRDAFRAGDTVLVSDLLQYEMPDLCTQWAGILRDSAASIPALAV